MTNTESSRPVYAGPTVQPPSAHDLAGALERNIDALVERQKETAARATLEERIAEGVTRFTGSMLFVYIHLCLFGFWILANIGFIPGVPRWDESLVVLAMIASVEAIFLSTFVLISQNRMAAVADKRADLNLQISLLTEHETTKLIAIVSEIAKRLDVDASLGGEVEELKRDVAPEAVLDRLESKAAEVEN